jgi:calcium binding protein 39
LQALEDVSRSLSSIKTLLCSSGADQESQTDVLSQLAQELYANNMLQLLIDSLGKIDFEVSVI